MPKSVSQQVREFKSDANSHLALAHSWQRTAESWNGKDEMKVQAFAKIAQLHAAIASTLLEMASV